MSKPEGHDEALKRSPFARRGVRDPLADAPAIECFFPAEKPHTRLRRKCLAHVLLPVLAAGYIYTLWGSRSFFAFRWFEEMGLGSSIAALRRAAHPVRHLIPSFVLFSVPAALWLYAATAVCVLIWAGRKAKIKWVWIALPLAIAVGSEIGQRFRIVPGTFDVYDLLAYGTAAIAAYTLLRKQTHHFSRR